MSAGEEQETVVDRPENAEVPSRVESGAFTIEVRVRVDHGA